MTRLRDLKDERKNVVFVSQGWIPRGPAEELKRFVRGGPPLPMTGQGTSGRIGIGPQPGLYDASFCDRRLRGSRRSTSRRDFTTCSTGPFGRTSRSIL
jgi:hypothetical protein